MPEAENTGILRILTERAGTVSEITQFLVDLEAAYLALYNLDRAWSHRFPRRHMMFEFIMETGFPYPPFGGLGIGTLTADTIVPDHRLVIVS